MELDSVRELKALLADQVLAPLTTPAAARTLSLSARPVAAAKGPHRTFALGIMRAGRNDYRLAVRVQRRELAASPQLETIRKQCKGELDERYIGRVVKQDPQWYRERNRPLRIGVSIGHYKITAGTLGCFVTRRKGDGTLVLSCNHVLADENRAKVGDPILQPGPYDGGTKGKETIGTLAGFVKLKRLGTSFVDCAVAAVKKTIDCDTSTLTDLGKLAGLGDVVIDVGDAVSKVGRTTGLTHGRVTAFELDNVLVEFGLGVLRFDNQIEIEGAAAGPFSEGGDSGSLIVDDQLRGVGLLFAGSDSGGSNGQGLTFANPLHRVLDDLKVNVLYT